jgi:hypothetical protein
VSALLEYLDEVRSDPAGRSGDGNLLAPFFGLHGSSFPSALSTFSPMTNGTCADGQGRRCGRALRLGERQQS